MDRPGGENTVNTLLSRGFLPSLFTRPAACMQDQDLLRPAILLEIQIHPGLDQAGGDQSAGFLRPQPAADFGDQAAAMGRILPCGQVDQTVKPGHPGGGEQIQRMTPGC